MNRDYFHEEFDEGTLVKLQVFRDYFRESIPVFVHSSYFREILIYDFFAGKGRDDAGHLGTSLQILSDITPYCDELRAKRKRIVLVLNDRDEYEPLVEHVHEFLETCSSKCKEKCIFIDDQNLVMRNRDFREYFGEIYDRLRQRPRSAKLIFLDPYNFIIDRLLLEQLISLPSTDFLCFMPSSFLRRFPNEAAFKRYIDTQEIDFQASRPSHCHRVVAGYYESLIDRDKEYYVGSFSIQKGSNYYGLLFGSSHTLGAEKFQRVCWRKDPLTGEADFNIDRELAYDRRQCVLFDYLKVPQKVKSFEALLRGRILRGEVTNDVDAYKLALKSRCLVKHAADVLNALMKENLVKRFRTRNSDVHKIKKATEIILL